MYARAEVPITWPSEEDWRIWWGHQMRDLEEITLDENGVVREPGAGPPAPLEPVFRLRSGPHLAPGAAYRAVLPLAPRTRIDVGLAGEPRDRVALVRFAQDGRRGRAEIAIDGLDRPREITTTSSLRPLRWEGRVAPERHALVTGRVRLRWAGGSVSMRVVPALDGDGERLQVRVQAHGRGLWRVPVALLGTAVGSPFRRAVRTLAEDSANVITGIALDPRAEPVDRTQARLLAAAAIMRERMTSLTATVEARRWRTAGTWRREHDALPAAAWPSPVDTVPDWHVLESEVRERVRTADAAERQAVIEAIPADLLRRHRETHAQWRAIRESAERAQDQETTEWEDLTDDLLSLAWLRSPLAIWRFGRRQEHARSSAREREGPATETVAGPSAE